MKKNQILGIWILVLIVGISFYVFKSRQYVESDPFTLKSNSSSDSSVFFTFKDQKYSKEDFNYELLEALYTSNVRKYQEMKTAIYVFALMKKQNPDADINNMLPITEFFNTITTDKLFENWYTLNKRKYEGKDNAKSIALMDFKVQKISEAVALDGRTLEKDGVLEINMPIPKAPLEILNLQAYPSAGNPSSENRYVFIGSYLCKECLNFNKEVRNIFVKEKNDIFMTFIPYTKDPTSPDALLTDSAICVHRNNPESFWLYHNLLIANREIYKIKSPDEVWPQIKKTLEKVDLDPGKIISCLRGREDKLEIGNLARRVEIFKPRTLPIYFHNGIDEKLFKIED